MTNRKAKDHVAYVALGANLGDRAGNINQALALLRQTPDIKVEAVSSMMENPAIGGELDAPPFINAVARVTTTLGAHALLHILLEIEKGLGRTRHRKWASRTIDLDIILFGDDILSSRDLVIPHPLMHERRFVLQPLAEIAPDAVHPVLQMTIGGLLQNLLATSSDPD